MSLIIVSLEQYWKVLCAAKFRKSGTQLTSKTLFFKSFFFFWSFSGLTKGIIECGKLPLSPLFAASGWNAGHSNQLRWLWRYI